MGRGVLEEFFYLISVDVFLYNPLFKRVGLGKLIVGAVYTSVHAFICLVPRFALHASSHKVIH